MTIFPHYFSKDSFDFPADFPLMISINQIERAFPSHRHDFLEISFVIGGRGREIVNGVAHPMEPGTFTFILPYQIHEIRVDPGHSLRLYNCMFGMELLLDVHGASRELQGLMEHAGSAAAPLPYHILAPEQARQMEACLNEMLAEYQGASRWRRSLIHAKLTECLIRFDRIRGQSASVLAERPGDDAAVGSGRATIWQVLYHIHTRYQEALTLEGLSRQFHFHTTHLCELIKAHTGQTFVKLLREIRVRQACALLLSTDMKVSDIAYEVGCGSVQSLFRMFREIKGMTPGAYRETNASDAEPVKPDLQ